VTWLARQDGGIPRPEPTPLTAPFWEGCALGELRFQRCGACAAPTFVPDLVCRACGGRDLRWERSSGRGRIDTWSVVWRPQVPEFVVPYAPAVVALEEGFSLLTDIVDCDDADLRFHQPVEVVFHEVGDGVWLPYFRPRSEEVPCTTR
jgi:uncharacterized OB-fold protein